MVHYSHAVGVCGILWRLDFERQVNIVMGEGLP